MTVAISPTGGVGVGSIPPSGLAGAGSVFAQRAPDRMRALLEPGLERYCNALMAAIDDPYSRNHGRALDVFPKIMGAVGGGNDMALALLAILGVRDQSEALALVSTARSAEGVGLEAATQQAITLLSRRIKSEPGFREDCARTLFGVDLSAPGSFAVVEEAATVPHSNGNGPSRPE